MTEGGSEVAWSRLSAHVVVLVQLCQRGAALLDEKGREQLWFPLLDCLMEPRRNLADKLPAEQMQSKYILLGYVNYGMDLFNDTKYVVLFV